MINKIEKKFRGAVKDKDNRDIVKGGSFAFINKVAGIGLNYIWTFLLAHMYGSKGTGAYNIFQTVFQFFSNFGKLGYDTLMMRETARYNAVKNWRAIRELYFKVLRVNVFAAIVCSALMFLSADLIAGKVFLKPGLAEFFRIGALAILPFVLHSLHVDCIRGMKRIFYFGFFQNVLTFGLLAIIISASWFIIHDRRVPVSVYIISISVSSACSFWYWFNKTPMSKKKIETMDENLTEENSHEKVVMSEKNKIAFSLFLTSLLQLIRGWSDTIFLGRFGTEEDVGVYKVAFKIATVTSLTLTAMLLTVAPKIAELHAKGELKRMGIVAQNTTKLIFWTSAPVLILFILFPQFFMGIFGDDFLKGNVCLIILALGQFVNACSGPVGNLLMMTGKQDLNRNIVFGTTVITVTLNAIFIPVYGIIGAAAVNALGLILFNVIPLLYVKHYYGFYTFDPKHIFSFSRKKFLKQDK
ncbi:MAG TPA: hypothetical protein DCQ93_00435 [Bacteroidetes bacterium]|nr:hypothetical protein [Bacteroidota bacterium]